MAGQQNQRWGQEGCSSQKEVESIPQADSTDSSDSIARVRMFDESCRRFMHYVCITECSLHI